jgi:uncharacterized protein (DUF885 family)
MHEKDLYHDFYISCIKLDPLIFDLYPNDFPKLKTHFPPNFNYKTIYPNYLSNQYQNTYKNNISTFLKKATSLQQSYPDSLHLKLFIFYLKNDLESYNYPFDLLPINHMNNPYTYISEEASGDGYYTFNNSQDYIDYIKRLQEFQTYSSEIRSKLKEGYQKNITLPKIIVEKTITQLQNILKNKSYHNPNSSPHYPNFNSDLDTILGNEIKKTLSFLKDEYIHKARKTLGLSSINPEMYKYCVQNHITNSSIGIEEIYHIGLKEIHRIDKEMSTTLELLLKKNFKGRSEYITERFNYAKDPKNSFQTSKEALDAYHKIRKEIQETVIKPYFNTIKVSHDYIIKSVPDHSTGDHSAYYYPPNQNLTRKGTFYLNTSEPTKLSKNEVLALSLHEGNPGHHLQLTYKLDNTHKLPEYAKIYESPNAYVEGWGLYVETLGHYTNSKGLYQKYGQLKMEMLRSLRLVLDTGIHYYGWTLNRARKYYMKYLTDDIHIIDRELLRYVADPGQALSYKMGQLSFLKMQKKYLDDGFLLKQFHQKCFEKGELPLYLFEEVLEKEMKMKY